MGIIDKLKSCTTMQELRDTMHYVNKYQADQMSGKTFRKCRRIYEVKKAELSR